MLTPLPAADDALRLAISISAIYTILPGLLLPDASGCNCPTVWETATSIQRLRKSRKGSRLGDPKVHDLRDKGRP